MHAPELGAAAELRENLPGIEQAFRIEGALEALLLVDVDLGEHRAHEVALLDADAVLAGQDPADLHAEPQDVGAERFRLVQLARLVGVVEDERMQVAVAGVEDVGAAQSVFALHLLDAPQHPPDLAARDGAVHAVVVGRDAADRGKRRLAAAQNSRRSSSDRLDRQLVAPLRAAIASTSATRWSTSASQPSSSTIISAAESSG